MPGAEQIPDVEGYQASQREDSSQLLTVPATSNPTQTPDRPEGQTDPLLKRRSWAGASRDFANGEHQTAKYENVDTPAITRYGGDSASCHNLLLITRNDPAGPTCDFSRPALSGRWSGTAHADPFRLHPDPARCQIPAP